MTAVQTSVRSRGSGLLGDVTLSNVLQRGAVGGLIVVFIAAIGMFETFDRRKVIDPILSLGYAAIVWVPILFGYLVSKRQELEGVEAPSPGASNVVSGGAVGAIVGFAVGLFLLVADAVHLRDIFLNISPEMRDNLGFGQEPLLGAVLLIAAGAALGALGGSLHLLPERVRGILRTAIVALILFNFAELVIGNILRELGATGVDRFIYRPSRGLSIPAAVLIVIGAVVGRAVLSGRVRAVRERAVGQSQSSKRRAALIGGALLVAAGAFLPSLFGTYLNEILSNVGLFILLGLGLNVVVGYAGLLDLGYVAFFAVGAYTTAVVTSPLSPSFSPELAFFEALPWVLAMAAVAGLVIGTPVIRMRGDYLAIVTLGFGEIARIALQSDWLANLFGAAQGIIRISPLGPGQGAGIRVSYGYVLAAVGVVLVVIGFLRWRDAQRDVAPLDGVPTYTSRNSALLMASGVVGIVLGLLFPTFLTWTINGIHPPAMFRIVLVFAVIAGFIAWRLQESRVGRAWVAVREDEQIAQTMGINIVTTKLLAFVIGAMLASFGGALFAVKLGTIFPHSFQIIQSIIILVIVIVGGMGSLRGVAIGAVVLIGVLGGPTQPGLLREFAEFKLLLYGVILIWMMLQRPEGLWPSARRARELHAEEMMQDVWLKDDIGDPEEAKP
jgi:branched-chain amino acid transport system permease protein